MQLTPDVKVQIGAFSAKGAIALWNGLPVSHPLVQGESGVYFQDRMNRIRQRVEWYVAQLRTGGFRCGASS